MNAARRDLLTIATKLSRDEIAARCGVRRSAVDNWCTGLRVPALRARSALHREFGICPDLWALRRCHRVQR